MPELALTPANTALVLIDLQNGIVSREAQPRSSKEVMKNASRLAGAFRAKGAPVIYIHVDLGNFLPLVTDVPARAPNAPPPAADAMDLAPESGFMDGDTLITKRHWGAFAGTTLEETLRKHGVTTVVLCGISTNAGVESTARQGTGLGFNFVIVEDACASNDGDAHRFAFEKIFPRIARVRNTAEVITALA